jgi:hypothetical protein
MSSRHDSDPQGVVSVASCRSCGDPVSAFDKACPSCGTLDPLLPPSAKSVVAPVLLLSMIAVVAAGIMYVGYC